MDRFIRPKATVVPESAMIPPENLIAPPPTEFTHELKVDQPYYYSKTRPRQAADGRFSAGTLVVLLAHDGGRMCRVADARGLSVETSYSGLRKLSDDAP